MDTERALRGRRKVAGGAFARVKIYQLLTDADWAPANGCGVRFGHPYDNNSNVGDKLGGSRGGALTALQATRRSVRLSLEQMQRNVARLAVG